jgi:hypothetical protein
LLPSGVSKALATSPASDSVYFGVQDTTSSNAGIASFDLSCDDGAMTCAVTFVDLTTEADVVPAPGLSTVVDLDVSPDGRSVVATVNIDSTLLSFSRLGSGALSFFESFSAALGGASAVAISDSGALTLASGKNDQTVLAFAPEPTGALLGLAALGTLAVLAGRRRRNT